MIKKNLWIVVLMLVFLSCSKEDNIIEEPQQPIATEGYNMLLIGNSFFRPYADKLDTIAIDAGFINHNSTIVFLIVLCIRMILISKLIGCLFKCLSAYSNFYVCTSI